MNFFSILREDLQTHREGLLAQGFWAIAVYRISHPRINCRSRFIRKCWRVPNVFLQKFIELTTGITLPETAIVGRRLNIEHFGCIVIHGATVIGDDCVIRQGVTLGNRYVEQPMAAPTLGNRVQIGAGAKVLGGVRIGDDVVIGANAVVLSDIPNGYSAIGIPARAVARRP